jgi:hypothetical protein
MRYFITIPQAGLAAAGLIGRVTVEALIVLSAAARFFLSAKSDRITSAEGASFVWLDVGHLLRELPILWPGKPDKTRRNRISRALRELVAADLLETRRGGRGRLFVRLTELALSLETSRPTVPEFRDGTVPASRDSDGGAVTYTKNQSNEPCARAYGEDGFAQFWDAYPKRRDRIRAMRAWNASRSVRPPLPQLLAALDMFKVSREWQERDGRFVPYPATWLNGHRWQEVETTPAAPTPPPEPDPAGWLEALRGLFPGCWEPATFAELKRTHPEIAGQVAEVLSAATTEAA